MALQSYRDLNAWKVAMELVEGIYRITRQLPASERYGLKSQMQRAAVSIPANIAEGYGRSHRGDYLRHLSVARGSLLELETHLLIAERLEFLTPESTGNIWELLTRTGMLLIRLIRSLQPQLTDPPPQS